MKTAKFSRCFLVAGLTALVAGGFASTVNAAAPAAAQPEFVPPKSMFVWNKSDPNFGRDPFFPNSPERSGRWAPRKAEPVKVTDVKPVEVTTTNVKPPEVKPVETVPDVPKAVEYPLALIGIGGTRTAIINNITFLKGEKLRVVTTAGAIQVRLDEIRENAVVVTVFAGGKETQQVVTLVGQ